MSDTNIPDDCQRSSQNLPWNEPEQEPETRIANSYVHISVIVECPHCYKDIDIMNTSDTSNVDHNKDNNIANFIKNDHKKLQNLTCTGIKCSNCSNTFNVKGIEW